MKMAIMFFYVALGLVLYVNAYGGKEQCRPMARPVDLNKVQVDRCPSDTFCERSNNDITVDVFWKLDAPCDRDVDQNRLFCTLHINTPSKIADYDCDIYYHPEDNPSSRAYELRYHPPLHRNEHIFIECQCGTDDNFVVGEMGYYEQRVLYDAKESTDGMCVRGGIKIIKNP